MCFVGLKKEVSKNIFLHKIIDVFLNISGDCVSVYCVEYPGNQRGEKRGGRREVSVVSLASPGQTMEETECEVDCSVEAIQQRIEELCQCIELKQRMVKLKREELRK